MELSHSIQEDPRCKQVAPGIVTESFLEFRSPALQALDLSFCLPLLLGTSAHQHGAGLPSIDCPGLDTQPEGWLLPCCQEFVLRHALSAKVIKLHFEQLSR